MNDTKTASILQRVPAILAVTAQSYGLEMRAGGSRRPVAAGERRRHQGSNGDKPSRRDN